MDPEEEARQRIDDLLAQAGWVVQDSGSVSLYASRGVAEDPRAALERFGEIGADLEPTER